MMDPLACACWLAVSVASLHADAHGMNQFNPGMGVEVGAWHAGEYRNSLDRTSVYLGREFAAGNGPIRAGLLLGAVSGYRRIGGSPVLPLVAPFVSWEGRRFGVNVALLPNPIQWNESALALQVKVRL